MNHLKNVAPTRNLLINRGTSMLKVDGRVGPVRCGPMVDLFGPPPKEAFCEVMLRNVDDVQLEDVICSGSRRLTVVEVLSVNRDARETTVLCREIRG